MTSPAALPANEASRLQVLASLRVLDTEPEPLFEQIVQLARDLCGVPVSLISLVDTHRQWFKANVGLPGIGETHRDLSFCAHAILSDELMEVQDAGRDPRFEANPLVTGAPGIRFYAGTPLRMPSGECMGTLCVIDHTPRALSPFQGAALSSLGRIVATALDDRRNRVVASAAKNDFLSRASHELRTPLNAVIGFAQLLELTAESDHHSARAKTGTYAQQIRVAGEHMLALVTDLLDLSRAAAGDLQVQLRPVDLRTAAEESCDLLRGLAEARGVTLSVSVSPDIHVAAEPLRLRQVLLNLGSNAIKYNRHAGWVHFRMEVARPGCSRLIVEDCGLGMSEAQVARLFQPFDRLGLESTSIPGVGLGLVISRGLIEAMGGKLTVTSVPDRGTAVMLELQQAQH